MVNLITLKRNSEGLPVALHINADFGRGNTINDSFGFHNLTLGELDGGESTITIGGGRAIPFTLDLDPADSGVAGITAYRDLEKHIRHTTHPHGEISKNPSLSERVNGALLSIANIFSRLEKLEAEDGTIYTKWVVRGTELQCETDNRDDGYASVDLANGFIGKSHPISPNDDSDSSQLLRIKTPLGVLTIKTAVLELGKVRDAVNNGSDEAVHSAPHPTT